MSTASLIQIIRRGIDAGVLPDTVCLKQPNEQRPWPLVVLIAVGAWLSAIPLVLMLAIAFGSLLERGPTAYFLGVAVLASAVTLLRITAIPIFVEQLAVPGLVVGVILLAFGLYHDLTLANIALVLALVVAFIAALVPRTWLRVLFGIVIAILLSISISWHPSIRDSEGNNEWLSWHILVLSLLVMSLVQRRLFASSDQLARVVAIEAVWMGLAIAAVGGLSLFAGAASSIGGMFDRGFFRSSLVGPTLTMQLVSVTCTILAGAWLAKQWAALRVWWFAIVVMLLAVLGWFNASMGAIFLMTALCIVVGHMGIACFAAVSAAHMITTFYAQLEWPLTTKAAVLASIGFAFGALARYAIPANGDEKEVRHQVAPIKRNATAILSCGALVLVVANFAIWQKESLIKNGSPVFVELVPVDPRSLMQGDYMDLNFAMPEIERGAAITLEGKKESPKLVARRNERGVATLHLIDKDTRPKPGELVIELVRKDQRWILVTDAWFFKEGEADRWSKAKYGEFRVDDSGQALLVGLRGANLEVL